MKRKKSKQQPDAMNSWIAKFIAITTVLFFFGFVGAVTFYPVWCCNHPINMEFVNLAIGWIGGIATAVITYYFGSSSQSAEKNELIGRAIGKVNNPPQAINVINEKVDDKKSS